MNRSKIHKESHVAPTKYGSGDFYGVGIKQPVGRVREDYLNMTDSKPKKMKPPRSLA